MIITMFSFTGHAPDSTREISFGWNSCFGKPLGIRKKYKRRTLRKSS